MLNLNKLFKRLFNYIRPYRLRFYMAISLVILGVITNAFIPYMLGAITNSIVLDLNAHRTIDLNHVFKLILLFISLCLVMVISQYLSNILMTQVVQRSIYDLRMDISQKINCLKISYFDSHKQGDILSRITNDVEVLSNALQQGLINILYSVLSIIVITIIIFTLNYKLALILIIMVPLTVIVSKILVKYSHPYFEKQQNYLGEMQGFVHEAINGFDVVKLYGQEQLMESKFHKVNQKLMNAGFKANMLSSFIMPLVNFITYGAYIAVGTVGSIFCLQGTMTVGQVQAFIQYVWQINQPLNQISQLASVVQGAIQGMRRIFEFLDEDEDLIDGDLVDVDKIKGNVQFKDVSFSYTNQPLIENLNLNIKEGQTVAIVGHTGAGKTTIVNLLMRFYELNSGMISIDGIDISTLNKRQMREIFGMVLQDSWLFEGTIMENLRFGNLKATDEEIFAIARKTKIDQYINKLPDGYKTIIKADNQFLSEGQKQLLTITRAMISHSKILILDEATSSVDTKIEADIQLAMEELMKHKTSFVIAHRLSTIKSADLILVMEQGKIIEQGTHQELMAINKQYAKLYNSQFA